jgi:hypothetical protein
MSESQTIRSIINRLRFAKTQVMLMVLTLHVMGVTLHSHDLDDSATAVSDSDRPQAEF